MNELQEQSDITFVSRQEIEMLENGRRLYELQGRRKPVLRIAPERKVTKDDVKARFGLDIALVIISTLGAAYLSAVRVGSIMEIAQMNLATTYLQGQTTSLVTNSLVFWASMFAFEGSLVGYGLHEGRRQEGIRISQTAIFTAFAVTILAGFLASLTLVDAGQLERGIAFVFAGVSGVAASFIAYFGAKNGGFIMQEIESMQAQYDQTREELQRSYDLEYAQHMDIWEREFQAAWPRIAKQVYGQDRRRRVSWDNGNGHHDDDETIEEPRIPNLRASIKAYMKQSGVFPSQVGDPLKGFPFSPASIAEGMGLVGKDRDSVRKYMPKWKEDEKTGRW